MIGNGLIAQGILIWFLITMLVFIFRISYGSNFIDRFGKSVKINLRDDDKFTFGKSVVQLMGMYWILIGITFNFIGESFLHGTQGRAILLIVCLVPVFIGIIIIERRKKTRN
jgi:hypothetical protein